MGGVDPKGEQYHMIIDLSNVPHSLRTKIDEIFRKDYDLKIAKAIERQKRSAHAIRNKQPRSVDGIGEQTMSIDPVLDSAWRAVRGRDVWEDLDFKKWFLARNEEMRVKASGTKMQVGYLPPDAVRTIDRLIRPTVSNRRFLRVYQTT